MSPDGLESLQNWIKMRLKMTVVRSRLVRLQMRVALHCRSTNPKSKKRQKSKVNQTGPIMPMKSNGRVRLIKMIFSYKRRRGQPFCQSARKKPKDHEQLQSLQPPEMELKRTN